MRNVLDRLLGILFFVLLVTSCTQDSPEPKPETGSVEFNFNHEVDGLVLTPDTLMYENDAGNKYMVNEIQYFISDIYLIKSSGSKHYLNNWDDIHYIDTDIKETHALSLNEHIPAGTYEGIGFTFGINDEKNQSLMFVNPPESFMFWPENLGGGYHYLKLNGKWIDQQSNLAPFNFHLGIGQIYYSYPDSIKEFVHNDFSVHMLMEEVIIISDQLLEIDIHMNVNNWFRTPNEYDHDFWGGDIMQNQEAMSTATENGVDVFHYSIKGSK